MMDQGQLQHVRNNSTFNIVQLLKVCATQKDLGKGSKLHAYIMEHKSLEKDSYVASTLVNMYAKCGALAKAQQVLQKLPVRDVVTWNALIAGYAQQGQGEEALRCIDCMQREGHSPNTVTFTCALRACASIGAAAEGEHIHEKIVSLGMLENDIVLGNSLVDMYAKCGALVKAKQVLEELPDRNAVTWNALITGCVQQGEGAEALKCFDIMVCEGYSPSTVTLICALKACASIGAVTKGEHIHDKIINLSMLEQNIVLGNSLVDMYAKCGVLAKAQQVLEELPARDVVTWSTLIAGYAQQGQGEEALKCFDSMCREGHTPNTVTFTCALKACGSIGAVAKGEQIHERIVNLGLLEKNVVLGNTLVDMYVKCGAIVKAQQVLQELPVRDVVTWSVLIAGYVQHGQGKEALKCFDKMQCEGHSPNTVTFTCALRACGSTGAAAEGEQIHEKIARLGMLAKDIVLANTLVDMYAKCGALAKAQQVLEELPTRDVATWSALIAGYAQQGQGEKALECYNSMQREGHSPDAGAFTYALKACGIIGAAAKGEDIHDKVVNLGMLEKDVMLGSTLVDMYAKCGLVSMAQQVLDELPVQDVITWNALITAYAQQGQGEEALKCFDSMQQKGHSPDSITFTCALKACASIGAAAMGKEIHDRVVSLGLLEKSIVLGNALVDMHAKCGSLGKAQEVLELLPARDVITWNALLAGYVQHGQGEEALRCFDNMQREGCSPNTITFICALKACGSIGAATRGKQIHDKIANLGMLEKDTVLGSALVDMYVKCAAVEKALAVLKQLPVQNAVAWNALIGGFAQQGQSLEALDCFGMMQCKPDSTTMICMLNACSHSGLSDQAEILFSTMARKHGIVPDVEHYSCMVDLYVRAGKFRKALGVIEKMSFAEYLPVWNTLLGACRKWGEVKIGRFAFEHALLLDENDTALYFGMEDIYATAGLQEEADQIEIMRVADQVWDVPGCCRWTDVTGKVHFFSAREKEHVQSKCIYVKLKNLECKLLQEGYSLCVPNEDVLYAHTEKLAVMCALINTPPGTSIFIVKNMKICVDCHRDIIMISKVEKRAIKVRDDTCLHTFEDGRCFCGAY